MKGQTATAPPEPADSFERQARCALERVRAGVIGVVAPVLGKDDVRAADLVDALGIDTRLAWKFAKIMSGTDVLAVAKYLPGDRGMKLLLRAGARRGAPATAVQAAREAFAALVRLIRQQAGNRRTFDMMVTGHALDREDDVGLAHRKAAFEHNGYIWGVQARAQIHSYLIQPSDDAEHLDIAVIRGFIDLRRVRPQIVWRISRFYSIDEQGQVRGAFERHALDPACAPGDVPLLRPFCSQPLPSVRKQVGRHGIVDYVLAESDVGNTQAVTCLTAEVIQRAEPCHPTPEYSALGTIVPLRTPSEVVVSDVFVHRGFFGVVTPALRLVSDLFNETLGAHYSRADRLPFPCHVRRLSDGPQAPPISEFAQYAEAVRFCFARLAWDPAQFSCYRVRLPFPPIPAALVVDYPLPERRKA